MKTKEHRWSILIQIILLALSLWFLMNYYPQLHPLSQVQFKISKSEAIEKANEWVGSEIPPAEREMTVSYVIDNKYFKKQDKIQSFMAELGFHPFQYWDIYLISKKKKRIDDLTFSSGKDESSKMLMDRGYSILLSPEGKVLKLDFEKARREYLKENWQKKDSLEMVQNKPSPHIKTIAYQFLHRLGEDTTQLSFVGEEVKQDSLITIYTYTFARVLHDQKIPQQIKLTESGNLLSYEYQLDQTKDIKETFTSDIFIAAIVVMIFLSLIILMIYFMIKLSRQESISFKIALPLASTVGIMYFVQSLLSSWQLPFIVFPFSTFLPALFLMLIMWLLYAICDATARQVWDEKLLVIDQFRHGRFFSAAAGKSIWRGFILGTYALALYIGSLYVYKNGLGKEIDVDDNLKYSFTIFFPMLVLLLQNTYTALFNEFFFRLFGISLLKKWFKKNVWILLAGSLFAIFFPTELEATNQFYQIALRFLPNLLFIIFFLQYEIVTTIIGLAVFHILSTAIIFSKTTEPSFNEWGISLYLILFSILLIAILMVVIKRREEETPARFIPDYIRKKEEKDRLLRELEIARTVQQKFLPRSTPQLSHFQLAAFCQPAWEVGGDYFDFFSLDDRRLGIAIGDVSNKGVSAAFYMTMVKGFLKALTTQTPEPIEVLSTMNSLFYQEVERGNFISMIYGILDDQRGEFTFARAGHNPLLHLVAHSPQSQWLSPSGVGIGLLPDEKFRSTLTQEKITLQSEDILILYTDGYPEAMNEKSEQFGEERLQSFIRQHTHLPAAEIIQRLETMIKKWEGNREALDDRTIVIIKKI